ncbi:glycoside hydrolase family 13 protein [Janibacter sp. G1551]|uniref:glycoside hydrolase family 13 protein n=1 Tax=Janibacter sp. G1551 TaxID=3420440 RepID=UPI003D008614
MTDLQTTDLHAADPADSPWWRDAVIYQVYPRSWADGDGDGVGDLPGITSRLGHLAELGVDAIWFSPFFRSPQKDAGYDVSDYRDIDPLFGTLADADALLARAHELGLRIIVDLVPNHSSDQHAWFQEALAAGPGSEARERYMFRDGLGADGSTPPNDWRSVFGGPAWTRITEPDGTPGQWYLHLFDSSQPDFNWANPVVREEFESVLRFWLDRGVDGFRVDVAHGLIKKEGLPPFPLETEMISQDNTALSPFWDQDGVHEIYRAWRSVLDEYEGDRIMCAEAWVAPAERAARYVRPDEFHQAFNFGYLEAPWRVADLRTVITDSLSANDSVGAPATWVLSNHDVVRHASRLGLPVGQKRPNGISASDPQPDAELGLRRARAASLLMLALPGGAYLYQGEELGLPEHTALDHHYREDPTFHRTSGTEVGRDGCRVPMPWERDAPAYGFSATGASWLPQPPAYGDLAADQQAGVTGSTLELYRAALALRDERGLGLGGLALVGDTTTDSTDADTAEDAVLTLHNTGRGGEHPTLVIANLGTEPVALPEGSALLLASGPLTDDGLVPTDTTIWAAL